MRVQSSLTMTQEVGDGLHESAELSYHDTGSRRRVL